VTGNHFTAATTVAFSGSGITVNTVTFGSATSLTVNIDVAPSAPIGTRDVTVANPSTDHGTSTCAGCFTINASPDLTSAAPNQLGDGATSQVVALHGTGFQNGATVSINLTGVTIDNVAFVDATQLNVTMTVGGAAPTGARTLTVNNPDGGSASCSSCFSITPAPIATSAAPSALGQGATSQTVTITGTGFVTGVVVSISGTGVTAANAVVTNSTSMTVDLTVSPTATTGARNITLTNTDHGTATCIGCFTVHAGPAASSITPPQKGRGLTGQSLTVMGVGFTPGTTVAFSGTGITVNSVTFFTGSHLTVNIDIAGGAATGSRNVTFANADHGTSTCTGCFSVTGPTTVTFTNPATLAGSLVATFSQAVSGVSPSNFFIRFTGHSYNLGASLSCKNSRGLTTSCSSGSVKTASLSPTRLVTPGQYFTAYVAPTGSPAITDFGGLTVAPNTHPFRASTNEQAESSSAVTCAWRTVGNTSAFGGSFTVDHLAGARASFRFAGTSVIWYTNTGPHYGLASLYIDGVLKARVNTYAAANHYRAAFTLSGLRSAQHTLQILVVGSKGSSHGTGTDVAVDAFRVGRTTVSSPSVSYTWQVVRTSAASGGAYIRSDTGGSSTSFSFRGTRVDWYTVTGPGMGAARVYIDGVLKLSADNYSATTHYGVARSFTGLTDAVHTVRIVVLGTHRAASSASFVAIDRFMVF
jgi:hypothetical protein